MRQDSRLFLLNESPVSERSPSSQVASWCFLSAEYPESSRIPRFPRVSSIPGVKTVTMRHDVTMGLDNFISLLDLKHRIEIVVCRWRSLGCRVLGDSAWTLASRSSASELYSVNNKQHTSKHPDDMHVIYNLWQSTYFLH